MRKLNKQKMAGLSEKCSAGLCRPNTFLKTCQDIAPVNALSNNTQKTSQVFAIFVFCTISRSLAYKSFLRTSKKNC
jgi:hypothetical protein